jgi:hypothetical protein
MSTPKRIYIVEGGRWPYLVKAYSKANALQIIAERKYTVRAATTLEVADLMRAGKRIIETTTKEENHEQ